MSQIVIGGLKMSEEEGIIAVTFGVIAAALGIGAFVGRDKLGKQTQPQAQQQNVSGSLKTPQSPATASSPPGAMEHNVLAIRAVDSNGQAIRGAIIIVSPGGFEGYADSDGVCLVPMRGPQGVNVEVHKPHNGKNGPGVQYPVRYKGGIHSVTILVTERDE